MLIRDKTGVIRTYAFILSVELQDGETTPEAVVNALSDSLNFKEGVGRVEIENLGELDVYEDRHKD